MEIVSLSNLLLNHDDDVIFIHTESIIMNNFLYSITGYLSLFSIFFGPIAVIVFYRSFKIKQKKDSSILGCFVTVFSLIIGYFLIDKCIQLNLHFEEMRLAKGHTRCGTPMMAFYGFYLILETILVPATAIIYHNFRKNKPSK
jgi:hypothetical protein